MKARAAATSPVDALRDLFDALPDVQAWIKDAKRRYLWVNRTFLLNYGMHQLTEVLGKTEIVFRKNGFDQVLKVDGLTQTLGPRMLTLPGA